MTHRLEFRPAAEQDLAEAYAWYESRRAGLGAELVVEIDGLIDRIRSNPLLYPEVYLGIRRALLRHYPYGVFYRVQEEVIQIIAVFHIARDPQAWIERKES